MEEINRLVLNPSIEELFTSLICFYVLFGYERLGTWLDKASFGHMAALANKEVIVRSATLRSVEHLTKN